jgi:hypothetical protein
MEAIMDELFAMPDADHSPAAYWFWHRLPTVNEIRDQVREMQEGGIHSFQIQARLAYPIEEYLGPGYLSMCKVAVEEAAARSMTVGIYDEYNWQSGQAGGRTVHGADHLRERHIFWSRSAPSSAGTVTTTVDGIRSSAASLGEAGMRWQYDGGAMSWADWEVVAVIGYPATGLSSLDQAVDLTASSRVAISSAAGCVVETRLAEGAEDLVIVAFVGGRCATSRVPNYLLAETALRFIQVGYEPFFQSFGSHFGSTVKYFFFDQPHATFYDWAQRDGNLRSSIPYADELGGHIEASTGHSFACSLLALLDDVGDQTATLRLDFYQAYTDLVLGNYLGTLSRWAKAHDVALSGHEVLGHVGSWHPSRAFRAWDLRVNFGLDYFRVDSYRDITGVDAQDCVAQLSTKMGDSVARSNGRSGCIVEQYIAGRTAGTGAWAGLWGLSLEDLRAQALRLQILGARQFLYHGFYQTDGYDNDFSFFTNPRFDFPPGINFEPWWPFYRSFADEAARLSVFLDGVPPVCEVAVLYPLRTAWMEGSDHSYGSHVEFWSAYLASRGFGFHFIDERDLLRATFADGELHLADRSYACLVLPSVTSVGSLATISALAAFIDAGGLLVATGDTPEHLQRGAAGGARRAWAKDVAGAATAHVLADVASPEVADELLGSLRARRPYAVAEGEAPIWQWAGREEHGWRLVLFNDTRQAKEVILRFPFEDAAVARWDAVTGEQDQWRTARPGGDGHGAVVHVDAMELCCLKVRPARADADPGADDLGAEDLGACLAAPWRPPLPASDEWAQLSAGWLVELPAGSGRRVPIDVSSGWEQQGFPEFSGAGKYVGVFEPGSTDEDLLIDLPVVNTAVEVEVNGRPVGRRAWSPYRFVVPRGLLRPGTNEIALVVYSAAGNRYYSHTPYQDAPEPSGLGAPPTWQPVVTALH